MNKKNKRRKNPAQGSEGLVIKQQTCQMAGDCNRMTATVCFLYFVRKSSEMLQDKFPPKIRQLLVNKMSLNSLFFCVKSSSVFSKSTKKSAMKMHTVDSGCLHSHVSPFSTLTVDSVMFLSFKHLVLFWIWHFWQSFLYQRSPLFPVGHVTPTGRKKEMSAVGTNPP